MPKSNLTLLERLLRRVAVSPQDGCWLFTGYIQKDGYGVIGVGNHRTNLAHRVSYELHKGSIPADQEIDHACHVPENCLIGSKCLHRRCVNPNHLRLIFHVDNVRNGNAGRLQLARTHCPSGHPYSPENTYIKKRGQRVCVACCSAYDRFRRARLKATAIVAAHPMAD